MKAARIVVELPRLVKEPALPLSRESGDKVGEATALTGIGSVYDDLGDEKKAIGHYEQSYHLAKAEGDPRGEATALNNIGSAYDETGDRQKAIEYYVHSLPLYKASGDSGGEANTLSNIMHASKNPRLAIFYGKQSVNTYQQIRSVNKDVDKELHKTFVKSVEYAYRYLAKLLIVQGRLAEAHQVLNSFKDRQYFDFNPETARVPSPLDPTRREAELAALYEEKCGRVGALAILASLWKVDDQTTSRLMTVFYQTRQSNRLTKAEALQKAQLSLLKDSDYSHPYYWSPFILTGNWR